MHGAYQQAHVVEGRTIAASLQVARRAAHRFVGSPAPGSADGEPSDGTDARWLADAHVAMLITRDAELERLAGEPPAARPELLAAARQVVTTS